MVKWSDDVETLLQTNDEGVGDLDQGIRWRCWPELFDRVC
jgi:hypothetical protein